MDRNRLSDLTEAILDLASLAAQILAHMARSQGQSAPDAPPPERVFRELIAETLRPVLERHPSAASEAARQILSEAVATIEAEILLVEPSRLSREPRHRSRPLGGPSDFRPYGRQASYAINPVGSMSVLAWICYTEAMDRATHRTTVDIELDAYEAALRELGTRGYRDTINTALREIGRQAALRRGASLIREGKLDLVSPEELAQMRQGPD